MTKCFELHACYHTRGQSEHVHMPLVSSMHANVKAQASMQARARATESKARKQADESD
jgi:hypothetical protein